jgi:nucleotide-binding universal stress UspA family protein
MISNHLDRPIVVGVDGSQPASHAALWATAQAQRQHAPLRLLYAVDLSVYAYTSSFAAPQSFFDDLETEGREQLAAARAEMHKANPGAVIDTAVEMADPIPMLIRESATAGLIVLGATGAGGFEGVLAGSTAVAVVAHASCPVAVIRPDTSPTGPVVVGVDGSAANEPALERAFGEAAQRDADLVAVHTWIEFPSDTACARTRRFFSDWEAAEAREREQLVTQLAVWQEKYPDVGVRTVITA